MDDRERLVEKWRAMAADHKDHDSMLAAAVYERCASELESLAGGEAVAEQPTMLGKPAPAAMPLAHSILEALKVPTKRDLDGERVFTVADQLRVCDLLAPLSARLEGMVLVPRGALERLRDMSDLEMKDGDAAREFATAMLAEVGK